MATIHELIEKIDNPELRERIAAEVDKLTKQKKFGLVFEEHLPECTPLYDIPVRKGAKVALKTGKVSDYYTVLKIQDGKALCLNQDRSETAEFPLNELVCVAEFGEPIYPYLQPLDTVCNAPDSDLWHTLIEADNYHALQLLEYVYAGKVDCIYIDPPYNTGARDWKYNNDYVDNGDQYRHSKWLSMMQKRLKLAKKLLNPMDSVLIVTIDEKEYLHLGCLLEEMFPEAGIQMVTSVINQSGVARLGQFYRAEEYLFYVYIGNATITPIGKDMLNAPENDEGKKIDIWNRLLRRGTNARRQDGIKQFYPFWIDPEKKCIHSVGDYIPLGCSPDTVTPPEPGLVACWPIHSDDTEGCWQISADTARSGLSEGTVRIGAYNQRKDRWSISYLRKAEKERIARGEIEITGKDENGALILKFSDTVGRIKNPVTVWNQRSHNAGAGGSNVLRALIPGRAFAFPKSVYAVFDSIRFVVANKPNALILDFFSGSGTTLHAVNLLNAEDGGHRRCIMVTNNEVSVDEAKNLSTQGYHPGDPEWERLGIARYVTWPRTVCSIEGHDVNGQPLKGNYLGSDPEHPLAMSDGFKANAVFFKLGFLDKNAVAVGRQFKELLSTLWMKAGAQGPCPVIEDGVPDMLILPENRMAILNDENCFGDFAEQLAAHPEIDVVFLVTDYEAGFAAMTAALPGKQTYQLYRDYLDNFRINAGRNAR
ncbi:MAG: site-specific DNA-methyltransferase [Clostridia bacterium]|nr:site-specific DNA-methyltransferase [Clostridia bacterium]